jgi:2-hydroxy-3-oxopropionate reductase
MTHAVRIGIVGLGSMGRPIGRKLIEAGYNVSGYDISPHAMGRAAADGIACADSPASLAEQCELILVMVWDDQALRTALFAPNGVLGGARLPSCVIDLSTTSVAVAREVGAVVTEGGATFLDGAIIGGGVSAVTAGTSPIVVAGESAAYERHAPVLAAFGFSTYVGRQGNAKAIKVVNNLLVGIVTAANAEALSLGAALGLDVADLVTWLREGPGGARVLSSYMGRYLDEGRYGEGLIGHRLMAKDLQLAAELAESLQCPAIYPRLGQQMYLAFGRVMGPDNPFPSAFEYFRCVGARPAATSCPANAQAH